MGDIDAGLGAGPETVIARYFNMTYDARGNRTAAAYVIPGGTNFSGSAIFSYDSTSALTSEQYTFANQNPLYESHGYDPGGNPTVLRGQSTMLDTTEDQLTRVPLVMVANNDPDELQNGTYNLTYDANGNQNLIT